MPDVFLSYSRKDSEDAVTLAQQLQEHGFDVWMDRYGIEAATQWSKEIVEAIEKSRAFLILLSEHSLESENVLRELAIASEGSKTILPVELRRVPLSNAFTYYLTGIQRTKISDFPAIIRSLGKLSDTPAVSVPQASGVRKPPTDGRKSLMVLPFEDLSPEHDNEWFADGIACELIAAMSNVKSLRLIDRQTSMSFKNESVKTAVLARELNVRYFLEGSVRKANIPGRPTEQAQIKINVDLLDIQTGDYLWQYTHKGVMEDIFDIQETVGNKVVEGLQLHLTKDENTKLLGRGTRSIEAYELYLRGREYFGKQTLAGLHLAISLFKEAIELDPSYFAPYIMYCASLTQLYIAYERKEEYILRAEELLEQAMKLDPDSTETFGPKMVLLNARGKQQEAEEIGKDFVRRAPNDFFSRFHLGTLYIRLGEPLKAIEQLERAYELAPENLPVHWNLVLAYDSAKMDREKHDAAERALTVYGRHIRLHPDDEHTRVIYGNFLMDAGRLDEAKEYLKKLVDITDPREVYNVGLLAIMLGDNALAMKYLTHAVDLGHRDFSEIKADGSDDIYNMPEFQALLKRIE